MKNSLTNRILLIAALAVAYVGVPLLFVLKM